SHPDALPEPRGSGLQHPRRVGTRRGDLRVPGGAGLVGREGGAAGRGPDPGRQRPQLRSGLPRGRRQGRVSMDPQGGKRGPPSEGGDRKVWFLVRNPPQEIRQHHPAAGSWWFCRFWQSASAR
ncbi:unnamed protein product, partial [Tetraodon nigroviridis]